LIGALAVALFNASKDPVARNFAYVYAVISIGILVCAECSHVLRSQKFFFSFSPLRNLIYSFVYVLSGVWLRAVSASYHHDS
jgi:hypothetical protein